jgi:hypothetical protein
VMSSSYERLVRRSAEGASTSCPSISFLLIHPVDLFLKRSCGDQKMHLHMPFLPNPKRPIGSLILNRGFHHRST